MKLLRFGIVSRESNAEATLARVCRALGDAIGAEVVPRVLPTFAELREEIVADRIELAWCPPISAVQLELSGTTSIAVGVFREGGSSYSSAIFVAASSPWARFEDLRGKRIAWVDRESAAGYLLPKLRLASLGLGDSAFAAQTFEGSHEAVVRAVLEGRADAGATHVSFAPVRGNIESSGWLRAGFDMQDVRILATAGPIPPDVIVVSKRVPDALQESIVEGLVSVGADEDVRDLFAGNGFVLVGRYQYDGLRALLQHR
ncbi:MAG: phosphate/phosphite/phosphonate ABC transporter substrate-binding protein [Polyangiales bacterium]